MGLEKQIAREIRRAQVQSTLKGEGLYLFENNTKGDLFLPKPTESGLRLVPKGKQFIGDNYYFCMLKTNELKLIQEIQSPKQLLTEQPPTVTNQGPVEFVQYREQQTSNQDVLLNESPTDGIKIMS